MKKFNTTGPCLHGSLGLSEAWMPIFEKSKDKSWDEKIYTRDETFNGKTIHVIGL